MSPAQSPATVAGGEDEKLNKLQLAGVGACLLTAGALASIRVVDEPVTAKVAVNPAAAHLYLAKVSPAARQRIDYASLDARLKRLAEQPTVVGLAVGVVENGRITFLSGYGETLEGSGDKVTPETVFRWASVSKGVASTAVAKLAEQGKLDLSAPVANYAPSLKLPGGAEYRATVSDVLSHRLGLYRNALDNKLEEGQQPAVLRRELSTLNAICAPGTCWSYQNIAYDAASEMVVKATNTPYEQALTQMLFAPIGMSSASVSRDGLITARSWARPHSVGGRPLEVLEPYYRVPAAGGVNSNIKDLALWMIAQSGGMPDVLSPRLLSTIHRPLVKTPGERGRLRKFLERVGDAYYGLGWRSYDYAGHPIVGHRGGVAGYRSLILFDPGSKSGVVALWNSNTSQPGGLEFEVMDMIFGLPFRDWMELDRKPGAPPLAVTAEPAPEEVAAVAPAGSARRATR
ncbi:serine hydrolase domain-containing protein [Sphingomonas sp. GCM10030256]|uniref:serine hydrolase domain-containing protein n=1 Tax=Sphingomonas sp. GCM10030256 TaxID=3273427 RepID=UPI0036170825